MGKPLVEQLLRPRIALPILAAVMVATLLLAPSDEITPLNRSGPLTTTSTTPAGAKGLYEIAQRLGWPVSRRHRSFMERLDSNRVYLVLDPPVTPLAAETHQLLDAVRRGAGLVYIASVGSQMDDSLHVRPGGGNTMVPLTDRPDLVEPCPAHDPGSPAINWFDDSVHLYGLGRTRAWPEDTTLFVTVESDTSRTVRLPAAVGWPLGAGRVVILSDPDLLRNDVIRRCRWGLGIEAMRMIAYAAGDQRKMLVFDEYHFGKRASADVIGAATDFLTDTAPGNTILQIAVAGLILLMVMAWRPVVPVGEKRIERRSALEHVEALARAYSRVGATRTAVRRLIRGLRRRHARKALGNDEAYLKGLAAQNPRLAGDVQRVLSGVHEEITPAELLAVGRAVDHIDQVLGT
ncbi:MAG TPA: DUF4350 domain-containing protein [Gemmatimonadaceae bacterium]|nr:DUF4350 domain-containing protein [Gemmatimonadaceae bacterium]